MDGIAIALPVGTQRLVAVLALRGRTGRSRLAGLLWPDTAEQRALASLRTGIWRVNLAAAGLVVSVHGVVELGLSPEVDVDRLIARSRGILGGTNTIDEGVDDDGSGADAGDLLPDWDDEWLDQERERLRQLRLHVLEATARRLTRAGQYGLALEAALAALRSDELRESAHRTVIAIHLAEGNVAEAQRAYDNCRRIFHDELGVEPSPMASALFGAMPHPAARRREPVVGLRLIPESH